MPELTRQTEQEYQKMLQIGTVDVGNNTLFAKSQKVAIDKKHVTLVISSGGSGASAIKEAIRTAEQKLEPDFSRYMKFVLVDSAENEIEGAKNQMGSSTLRTFNISVDGAQDRMEYYNRQAFFRTWVHKDYDTTQLDKHGSGRDRLTGKIKFYDASEGTYIDVKFRQMIREMYDGDWSTFKSLPVDIMILAGVSGGNGSGTYLELAAHARRACVDSGVTGEIRVFGYLFLPDVVENFEKGNLDIQNQLYTNGYAALKELESYMDISFAQERKEVFTSRDGVTNIIVDANNPLFNYPILISGDYDETKSMMAECIINLALQNNGGFDQNSFYSNTGTMRMNYLSSRSRLNAGLLTADSFPEDSHRYAGIGYAYASIPEKIITANIVSNVCREMYEPDPMNPGNNTCFCTTERRLPRAEMESLIRRLFSLNPRSRITEHSFWDEKISGKLNQVSTISENTREITKEEIRSGKTDGYKQGFNAVAKENDGKEAMKEHLKILLTSFTGNAAAVLKEYGPRVMEYLYTGKGPDDNDGNPQFFTDISIQKMLEFTKQQLQTIVADGKKGVEPSNDIPSGLSEFLFKKKLNSWKTEFHAAVQYQTKQAIARSMIEMQGPWEEIIANPIQHYVNQCEVFAKRLETLADFYKSEGNALEDASYERFVERSQQDNCVSLCNDANVFHWVKDKVSQKISSIPVVEVKDALISDFVNDQKAWVSMSEGVTRKAFDAVMANCCKLGIGAVGGDGLSLTATEYFNYVLNQVEPAQVADTAERIVERIVSDLIQKSRPAIRKENTNASVNRFMMLPQSIQASPYGNAIIEAFRTVWEHNGAENSSIALSPSVSDIVCYQTSVANGMCDLLDLNKWEKAYYASKSPSIHLSNGEYGTTYIERTKTQIDEEEAIKKGIAVSAENLTQEENIIFGRGLSWRHYPPLDLRNITANQEEKRFMAEIFNPVVDFALEQGVIERQEAGLNTYRYVMHTLPKNWESLDVSAYNERNEEGEYVLGEPLFKYLRNLNPLGEQEYTKEIRLRSSGYFDAPFDFTEARNAGGGRTLAVIEDLSLQYMKRILRRNTWLFLELRDTLNRYYPIYQQMKDKVHSVENLTKVNNFVNYFQYGLITEEKNVWYLAMNSSGTSKKAFCKFGDRDTLDYTAFETKLKGNWKTVLAIQKLTKQDFKTLRELLHDRLIDTPQEEIDQLKAENTKKLLPIGAQIDEQFAKRWPNRELFAAVEKELNPSGDADYKYVNIIVELRKKLEELEDIVPEPKETWDCTCGATGNTTAFCPKCGKTKPVVNDSDLWDCSCGKAGNTTAFCPGCGRQKPVAEDSNTWDCSCGKTGNTTAFCPSCGRQKPVVEDSNTWDCSCGRAGNTTAFCPGCGTPRPVTKESDTWDCTCGATGNTTGFCPECGKPKIIKIRPAESLTWNCPNCGLTGISTPFCPKCGNKR